MLRHVEDYRDLKICCYAISADEPEEIMDKWLESMKLADYIAVLITKSDNPNYTYFKEKQKLPEFKDKLIIEEKDITPWRFDVARNESMKLIPNDADLLVCTDIDETMIPDFWDDYRKCAFEHPNFQKIYYRFSHQTGSNGNARQVYWYDKTAPNNGYVSWKYPCHEESFIDEASGCEYGYCLDADKIYLYHRQNRERNREGYLDLIKLRLEENPEDYYSLFYVTREYSHYPTWDLSAVYGVYLYGKMYNDKKTQKEDSYFLHSLCDLIGIAYDRMGIRDAAEFYFIQGIKANSKCRDCYISLAQVLAYSNKSEQCYKVLDAMEKNTEFYDDWRLRAFIWADWKKYQIIADAKCWESKYGEAEEYLNMALENMKTKDDVNEAIWEGFFDDYNFCMGKLGKSDIDLGNFMTTKE